MLSPPPPPLGNQLKVAGWKETQLSEFSAEVLS